MSSFSNAQAQDRRRAMLRTAMGPVIAAALADPAVKQRAVRFVAARPRLNERLRQIARNAGLIGQWVPPPAPRPPAAAAPDLRPAAAPTDVRPPAADPVVSADRAIPASVHANPPPELTPRAARIYADLASALEAKRHRLAATEEPVQ